MGSKKRPPSGRLRWQIFTKSIHNMLSSPLCLLTACTGISALLLTFKGWWWCLAVTVVIGSLLFKRLVFEVFVVMHIIENSLGLWPWYTLIDDRLYLGAMPLQSLHHLSHLTLDLGIKCVVSVNQPYELSGRTMAGLPVQAEEWEEDGVTRLVLDSPDFKPPPFDVLDRGADFLRAQLAQKHKIYVHCKSGIGRSASVVIAYLIKHRGMPANAAAAYVRERRPAIFSPSSPQMANLLLYESALKTERDGSMDLKNV